jgi:DNA-binding response OmpR family regulator
LLLTEAFLAEKLSIEIDCVPDGDELLTRLASLDGDGLNTYGLVLLDVHMPRRSAEEVLMALNAQQRRLGIPLVVLTTLISHQHKDRLLNLGVREVISKPFDLGEYFALAKRLSAMLVA